MNQLPGPWRILLGVLSLASLLFLASCAGSGEGLDENGLPVGSAAQNTEPGTLASLQAKIFSPICSECHIGNDAPFGLRLDSIDNTYMYLVGVNSSERPDLMRVNPGDPDQSYIVLKVEGDPSIVGGQMPLNRTPLSPAIINELRDWIANGALQFPIVNNDVTDTNRLATRNIATPRYSAAINPETPNYVDLFLNRLKTIGDTSISELAWWES